MNRRGFLGAILAAAAAPMVVRAGVLMPVKTLDVPLVLWGDGIHDDSAALQALLDGKKVRDVSGAVRLVGDGLYVGGARFFLGSTVFVRADSTPIHFHTCAFSCPPDAPCIVHHVTRGA